MTISQKVKSHGELPSIAVIDLGAGNLFSVLQAVKMLAPNHRVILTTDPNEINQAERIVLPGQGAMLTCMRSIREKNLEDVIRSVVVKKPVFAICVGLQLFFDHSDEGHISGLGILPGRVKHLSNLLECSHSSIKKTTSENLDSKVFKIPHMGWSQVHVCPSDSISEKFHPVWSGLGNAPYFYFAHSFYVEPELNASSFVIGRTDYTSLFASVVAFNNVVATQFHPEKSGKNGLKFLKNFIEWRPDNFS